MPLWKCDFKDCSSPAVRRDGTCELCDRHICARHLGPQFHKCPPWEDADEYDAAAKEASKEEFQTLVNKINLLALAQRASSLRDGMPCSIHPLSYDRIMRGSLMGGQNYNIEIIFQDQVIWLARVRRLNGKCPPSALRDASLESEFATLRFLKAKCQVPVPEVYDFAFESSPGNAVGLSYILQEKLPGKACDWPNTTPEQREIIMSDLADIYIKISRHPLHSMGSLTHASSSLPGEFTVGPFHHEALTDIPPHPSSSSSYKPMGPFPNLQAYHTSEINLILSLISRGELYAHPSHPHLPVSAYLVHLFLFSLVSRLPSSVVATPTHQQRRNSFSINNKQPDFFFLRHPDDKGDHLLIDPVTSHITGIVDWESAYTAPASMAFNTSIMLFDVGGFYSGEDNKLSGDEERFVEILRERQERLGGEGEMMTNRVKGSQGRIIHRFAFCCGYDLARDWEGFLRLFRGLRMCLGEMSREDDEEVGSKKEAGEGEREEEEEWVDRGKERKRKMLERVDMEWDEWRRVAMEVFGDDEGLRGVLEMAGETRRDGEVGGTPETD